MAGVLLRRSNDSRHSAPSRPSRLFSLLVTMLSIVAIVGSCTTNAPSERSQERGDQTTIEFAFDIVDLRTDHQFTGQLNTFRVRYGYREGLRGSGFDPKGHDVDDQTYPYFQSVRSDLIAYARAYPHQTNFYEVFGTDIANHLMVRYSQLAWMTLIIDIPGYGGEPYARSVIVHRDRRDTGTG